MEGNFPNASFWDLDACVNKQEELIIDNAAFDVAIVGGGILGCSVARVLRNEAPHLRCVVVERGQRPLGASTRNAGFACFGSVGEIIEDINSMGAAAAKQLVERRIDGLRRLTKIKTGGSGNLLSGIVDPIKIIEISRSEFRTLF